uniref:Uncharacterized protein n=1 Tax=Glossina morsitans morsitans TaxID=37546 RepID=A0ABK9NFU2_GLOMM
MLIMILLPNYTLDSILTVFNLTFDGCDCKLASKEQLSELLRFNTDHPLVAQTYNQRCAQDHAKLTKLWNDIGCKLNSKQRNHAGGGPKEGVELTVKEEKVAELANLGAAVEEVHGTLKFSAAIKFFDSDMKYTCFVARKI